MSVEDLAIYKSCFVDNKPISTNSSSTTKVQAFLEFFNLNNAVKCPYAKTATILNHLHWNETQPFSYNLELLLNGLESLVKKCEEYRLDGFQSACLRLTEQQEYKLSKREMH